MSSEGATIKYIVRLERDGERKASISCENDSHVLEVVNGLLANTLDAEDNIRIDRAAEEDGMAELRAERDRLVSLLSACGGRSIEIAEEIDEINRELGEDDA
jgi:hypothetical protein